MNLDLIGCRLTELVSIVQIWGGVAESIDVLERHWETYRYLVLVLGRLTCRMKITLQSKMNYIWSARSCRVQVAGIALV